jgi:short-subunit dehydrogenase
MSKLVVVTGGTKGIGRAIVNKFSSQGFDVVTCSRSQQDLKSLKDAVERKHGNAVDFMEANLTDHTQVKKFTHFIRSLSRSVDVLVNNAGYFIPGDISTEEEGNLEQIMQANLFSAYHLTRGIVPGMKEKKSGHIFNMCSIASFMAYPNGGSYAISKFALLGFSRCLRAELRSFGIRVTAVMPGATFTDSWSGSTFPEHRFMPAEDIAEMVYASYSLTSRTVVEDIILRPQLGDI